MANFDATTASSGNKMVKLKKLRKFLDRFQPDGELQFELQPDGHLYIYGYNWFQVYELYDKPDETGELFDWDNDSNDEFIKGLQEFVRKGETYTIQSVGAEKCRFPLAGWSVDITQDKVKHTGI